MVLYVYKMLNVLTGKRTIGLNEAIIQHEF